MNKFILSVVLSLVCLSAHAEWNKTYSVDYIMGDGDNRVSARQAALELIKLKASNEAGSYVESTATLHEDGKLSESIQVIGAAMVKLKLLNEAMSVNKSGQSVLSVTASAALDETELAKRISVLRQDKEKARQMKILQSENESLRKDLEDIRKALSTKLDQARVTELLARQDTTIRRIAENAVTVSQVFERGTLLQLASKNSDALEIAKRDLDENFYAPLMRTKISAEIESVEESPQGYVALVRVGWEFDKGLKEVNDRYLKTSDYSVSISIYEYLNKESNGPSLLSERIYDYVAGKGVDLKLNLGDKEIRIPVLYTNGDKCSNQFYVRPENKTDVICLASQDKNKSSFNGSKLTNPVRIPLSKAEAERATSVEATWVMWTKQEQKKSKRQ